LAAGDEDVVVRLVGFDAVLFATGFGEESAFLVISELSSDLQYTLFIHL